MLGERLRGLAVGRSGRELARAAGLGIGTVRDLLEGRSDPTLGTMLALVEALELASIEELLAPLGTSAYREAQGGASARTA